ncbi:MAG: serine/threonine protein kinase with repeat [Gammaproteobacteria bacterium]|nr:serine/threonine protein kinase with repeat [Gammaproteobacteria bacterium]
MNGNPSATIRGLNHRMSSSTVRIQAQVGGWLLCIFLVIIAGQAQAGSILGLLGSHSGKLAKYEFTLNDSFFVTSVAWSPDGRYIASSSSQDNRIHIWDVQRRAIATELRVQTPGSPIHNVAWSPDGRYFAACDGSDGILHVYDVRTWIAERDVRPDKIGCLQVVFSSDGKQVAILGARLAVLSTGDWRLLKTSDLRGDWARGNQFLAVAYVPGTYTLLIGGSDHREHPKHIPGQALEMTGVVWILGQDETVPARHLSSYHIYGNYGPGQSGGAGEVISLAVSPDGEQVATGAPTRNGLPGAQVTESVHVLRIADGAVLAAPLDGQDYGEQHGLAYTSQGRYLIVGHSDHDTRAIHVIDAKTFQIVDVVRSTGFVYDVTASLQRFAAGTGTHIMIWSLPGGR